MRAMEVLFACYIWDKSLAWNSGTNCHLIFMIFSVNNYLQDGTSIKWPLDYFKVVTLPCTFVFKQSHFVFC